MHHAPYSPLVISDPNKYSQTQNIFFSVVDVKYKEKITKSVRCYEVHVSSFTLRAFITPATTGLSERKPTASA